MMEGATQSRGRARDFSSRALRATQRPRKWSGAPRFRPLPAPTARPAARKMLFLSVTLFLVTLLLCYAGYVFLVVDRR